MDKKARLLGLSFLSYKRIIMAGPGLLGRFFVPLKTEHPLYHCYRLSLQQYPVTLQYYFQFAAPL